LKVGAKVIYFYNKSWGLGFVTRASNISKFTLNNGVKYLVWIDSLQGVENAQFGIYDNKEYEKVLPYNQLFAILKGIE
jgi:hypothetical protein